MGSLTHGFEILIDDLLRREPRAPDGQELVRRRACEHLAVAQVQVVHLLEALREDVEDLSPATLVREHVVTFVELLDWNEPTRRL